MVKKILAKSYVYLILILMYIPIFVLIIFSFTNSDSVGIWNGFSLELYSRLFRNEEIMIAVGNTIIIALISAICSTILGTLGAIGVFYSKRRTKALVENLNQIPVVNAEIVMALSLTFMFVFCGSYIFKDNIFSFWTILFGHMVLETPFVYLNVKPKLIQMDPSLYEAALDLGCSPRKAMYKVMLPQIAPGVLSGFMFALTLSLDDFIVTAFLSGPGLLSGAGKIQTISTFIQNSIKKKIVPPELRALTTIIFLVVVIATILVIFYQKRQNNRSSARFLTKEQIKIRNIKRLIIGGISLTILITVISLIIAFI